VALACTQPPQDSSDAYAENQTQKPGTETASVDLEDITRDFRRLLDSLQVPGAQLAILKNEKLVFLRSFGVASAEGIRVADNSLFRIADISKALTLMALSRLVGQGRLKTDDAVFGDQGILGHTYGTLPYPPEIQQITVEHLITHTAGFTNSPTDILFEDPKLSQKDLIDTVLDNRSLAFAPGTDYAYSNFGYCLLGRILEVVSGKPYEQFVFEEILAPMNIFDMQLSRDGLGEIVPNEVTYFTETVPENPLNVTRLDAAAGWLASAYHLALLAAQTDGGSSFTDLLEPGEGLDYLGGGVWELAGSLPGSIAVLRVSTGISYAVLMNRADDNFEAVIEGIIAFMNEKTLMRTQWPPINYFQKQ
jgi:CubicO group peptidase (beta-lactamase class C family)